MSDTEDTESAPEAKTEEGTATESSAATATADAPVADVADKHANLDFLLDVPVRLTAELGNCQMTMHELLELELGSVVQLDQPASANVDVFVNQKLVARGEVVVADDNFGIRIKEIVAKPTS
jgi:flagellar motor switch protein FliN/FliY